MRARYLASFRLPGPGGALPAGAVTGESTPSYLLYGRSVLRRIKAVRPPVRRPKCCRNKRHIAPSPPVPDHHRTGLPWGRAATASDPPGPSQAGVLPLPDDRGPNRPANSGRPPAASSRPLLRTGAPLQPSAPLPALPTLPRLSQIWPTGACGAAGCGRHKAATHCWRGHPAGHWRRW